MSRNVCRILSLCLPNCADTSAHHCHHFCSIASPYRSNSVTWPIVSRCLFIYASTYIKLCYEVSPTVLPRLIQCVTKLVQVCFHVWPNVPPGLAKYTNTFHQMYHVWPTMSPRLSKFVAKSVQLYQFVCPTAS